MRDAPSNSDDVIDSRDVIARIEELEGERESAAIHTTCIHCGQDIEGTEGDDDWRDRGNNSACPDDSGNEHAPPEGSKGELQEEEATELATLQALASECEGYGDWRHGETLIRDSYFQDYAENFAEEIGAVTTGASWPNNCIDWQRAADQLKVDYMCVDFDGVEFWMRA